jgi:RNA polymerase sigma-70 factor (ECF subfamily)
MEDDGSDAAVVHALRRGEARAELDAWNRFSARVDGTLRRLLGPGQPSSDREDLLQEVFIRFFRRVDTLREPAAVRGFLTGICLRVVQGELAGRRRRRWLRLTTTGDAPDVGAHARDDESREAVRRYYGVLDALGGQDRSIFVARTIEGLTLEDIAGLHGVSVSTAQRRLTRATKRVSALVRRDPLLVALATTEKGRP